MVYSYYAQPSNITLPDLNVIKAKFIKDNQESKLWTGKEYRNQYITIYHP